ncbi:MAG: hypothetical protein EA362_13010 [Saprospirales bacterium]|nr:MAG: hypothetical protein EA362_13010 [Saprospirales bacterium]
MNPLWEKQKCSSCHSIVSEKFFNFQTQALQINRDLFKKYYKKHLEPILQKNSCRYSEIMDYLKSNYPATQIKCSSNCKMAIVEGVSLSAQQKRKLERYFYIRFIVSLKCETGSIQMNSLPRQVTKVSYYPGRKLYRLELNLWEFYPSQEKLLQKIVSCITGKVDDIRLVSLLVSKKPQANDGSYREKKNQSPIQFLTLDEIKEVDYSLTLQSEVSRRPEIGAISKFDISEKLISLHNQKTLDLLKKIAPNENPKTIGFFKQIVLQNVFLKKEVVEYINKNTAYSYSLHLLNFEINPVAFRKFLKERHRKSIIFMSEDQNDFHGLVLPDPTQNNFLITIPPDSTLSQLRFRAYWFYAVLAKIFPKEDIKFWHEHVFKIDKSRFYNYLTTHVLSEDYKINPKLQTIAFDFYDEDDFREKLTKLKSKNLIDLYGFSDIHRYKVIFTPRMESDEYSSLGEDQVAGTRPS